MLSDRRDHDRRLEAQREKWTNRGDQRPDFARPTGPGQESVWDYPRPPVLMPDSRTVEVRAGGQRIALTANAIRILETASPPTFYIPRNDVQMSLLQNASGTSFCEWKGEASYFDIALTGEAGRRAAWSYAHPFGEMSAIADHVSFYPARVECYVDGERVQPQGGGFYGGWVTAEIVGPWKGEPGTGGW